MKFQNVEIFCLLQVLRKDIKSIIRAPGCLSGVKPHTLDFRSGHDHKFMRSAPRAAYQALRWSWSLLRILSFPLLLPSLHHPVLNTHTHTTKQNKTKHNS